MMHRLRERSPKTQRHDEPGQDNGDFGSESTTNKAGLVFPQLHAADYTAVGTPVTVAIRRLRSLTCPEEPFFEFCPIPAVSAVGKAPRRGGSTGAMRRYRETIQRNDSAYKARQCCEFEARPKIDCLRCFRGAGMDTRLAGNCWLFAVRSGRIAAVSLARRGRRLVALL